MASFVPVVRLISNLVQKLLRCVKNLISLFISTLLIQNIAIQAWNCLSFVESQLVSTNSLVAWIQRRKRWWNTQRMWGDGFLILLWVVYDWVWCAQSVKTRHWVPLHMQVFQPWAWEGLHYVPIRVCNLTHSPVLFLWAELLTWFYIIPERCSFPWVGVS